MADVTVVRFADMPSWYQLTLGISVGVGVVIMLASFFLAFRELEKTGTEKAAIVVLSVGLALIAVPVAVMFITGVVVPTISN